MNVGFFPNRTSFEAGKTSTIGERGCKSKISSKENPWYVLNTER